MNTRGDFNYAYSQRGCRGFFFSRKVLFKRHFYWRICLRFSVSYWSGRTRIR